MNSIEFEDGTSLSGVALPRHFVSENLSIGFDFTFFDKVYTELKASSCGFLTFDNTVQSDYALSNNVISGSSLAYAIMPFWDGIGGGNIQSRINVRGEASYKTTGSSPNQVYTFEWLNFGQVGSSNRQISFQVKLYETSNAIELVYYPDDTSSYEASIGIKGEEGDFFLLDGSGATPMRSLEGYDFITAQPAYGQIYRFALRNQSSHYVDTLPIFGSETVADQVYTVGEIIPSLVLSEAGGEILWIKVCLSSHCNRSIFSL